MATIVADESSTEAALIRVAGEIDISNAKEIQATLCGHLRRYVDEGRAAIDLSGVRYLDSSGLRMIETLHRRWEERGITLTFVVPSGSHVRRLLEITGLDVQVHFVERWGDTLDAPPTATGSDPPG